MPSNSSFAPSCIRHFYRGVAPQRRANCSGANAPACLDLCHGDPTGGIATAFFASLQNTALRAPEWSAMLLNGVQAWEAIANNFPRPAWKLNDAVPVSGQYPLSIPSIWDGTMGYDKGHMLSKENFDFSESAVAYSMDVTNVVPQNDDCNRGNWLNYVETDFRIRLRYDPLIRPVNHSGMHLVVAIGYKDPARPTWISYEEGVLPD
jgi:hypothetical protein